MNGSHALRASCLTSTLLLVACASPPRNAAPSPQPAPLAASEDPSLLPSLAAQANSNDRRSADQLAQNLGVRVDELTQALAPDWFAAAATTQGRAAGTAPGTTLASALDAAITNAGAQLHSRGMMPAASRVERAAWHRLPTGQYAAWAALGDGSQLAAPLPTTITYAAPDAYSNPASGPRPSINSDSGLPSLQEPQRPVNTADAQPQPPVAPALPPGSASATPATSAPPQLPAVSALTSGTTSQSTVAYSPSATPPLDAGAPAWWVAGTTRTTARTSVGIRVDGGNRREVVLAALAAGRDQLAAALGEAPRQLLTDRTQVVTLPDGRARIYALVSCLTPAKPQP